MAHVYVSAVIPAPIGTVWPIIRDFNALPDWHPSIADSRIEEGRPPAEVGCIRNFNLKEGGTIREQLLTLSDLTHTCTYSILESPMPLTQYKATLRLTAVTEGNASFAEWWADFACDPADEEGLVELVGQGVFATGFKALHSRVNV